MSKIAVLGANGQVGAEVCLLLRHQPGVEVVPICRNRLGSAFLRHQGLLCRHGLITDPQQAAQLVGDCDVIANFALGLGRPAEARRQNALLIEHATRYASASAKIIYFSTMSVYGNPLPDAWIRWRSFYGREKIRCERWQRRVAKRFGRPVHILRLGHVCGDLQSISFSIRDQIAAGPVILAGDGSQASNTVHVATIVDAIVQIARGADPPGTYDLMCHPSWSWRQVYEHEAQANGLPLVTENGPNPPTGRSFGRRVFQGIIRLPKRWLMSVAALPGVREFVLRSMSHLPASWNENMQAKYYCKRAAAEVAALQRKDYSRDSFVWVPMGKRFLSSLRITADLLQQPTFRLSKEATATPFPDDLPLAAKT
jgi:nucleoside-diphosphate-sugar epimerase